MKKILLTIALFISFLTLMAQSVPPPPPGGHGLGNNQTPNGGNAPIGNGWVILVSLAAAYGGVRSLPLGLKQFKNQENDDYSELK
jgi:hypothetical protein